MHRAFKAFATPLLYPTNRVRMQCLLLLALLVGSLLYLEGHRDVPFLASLHWNTTASSFEYVAIAVLCWIVVGGRSPAAALALAGSIVLLNEGMRSYSNDATAEFHDVGIDLVVAVLVVLLLSALRTWQDRQGSGSPRSMDERCH